MTDKYQGQCFCHPPRLDGVCEHCNRARMWIDQDVLVLANELAKEMAFDRIENLFDVDGEQEIFEWYIITERLYEHLKLNKQNEPVAYWKDQYWWGRTCTGQSIEMDGTFQNISQLTTGIKKMVSDKEKTAAIEEVEVETIMTTEEMKEQYTVEGFGAPFVFVFRNSDGARGTLKFQHSPRLYWSFAKE